MEVDVDVEVEAWNNTFDKDRPTGFLSRTSLPHCLIHLSIRIILFSWSWKKHKGWTNVTIHPSHGLLRKFAMQSNFNTYIFAPL